MLLRDARKAMSRKDFPAACRILKGLIGGAERSSEVMVLMAWCVFNLPHHDRTQKYRVCRSRIEVELTLTGAEPESYYLLGRMAEDFGDVKEAFKQYSAALAIDRGYASAQARWRRLKKHKAIVATQTEGGDFDSFADIFDRMS